MNNNQNNNNKDIIVNNNNNSNNEDQILINNIIDHDVGTSRSNSNSDEFRFDENLLNFPED